MLGFATVYLGLAFRGVPTSRLSVCEECCIGGWSGSGILETSIPIVSIVVPCFGLTSSILRILKGNLQKGTTMETIGSTL